jgi:hypothetical protein
LLGSFIHFGKMNAIQLRNNTINVIDSDAGGGGERVLWTAIEGLLSAESTIFGSTLHCVIYTRNTASDKKGILEKIKVVDKNRNL